MNIFIIIVFIVCGGSVLLLCFYLIFRGKTKEEKGYEEYLAESMDDEFIYDPETGTKLTLEQAEKGHWINHNNEFQTIPKTEIEKYQTNEEKEVHKALNHLISEKNYRKTSLNEEQLEILEKTKILGKYDDWSCNNIFRLEYCEGIVFIPTVELHYHTGYEDNYTESQLMFWIKTKYNFGHYYLREKKFSEKIFDLIRNDDELTLTNYESFTFKKTDNLLFLNQILKKFEGEENFEIEFFEKNIFIKTLNLIHLEDILRIEKIFKSKSK